MNPYLGLAASLLALLGLPLQAQQAPPHVAQQLIIMLRPQASEEGIASLHAGIRAVEIARFTHLPQIRVIQLPAEIPLKQALEYYAQSPQIEYVELNFIYEAVAQPNDPELAQQWGLTNTGQGGGLQVWTSERFQPGI